MSTQYGEDENTKIIDIGQLLDASSKDKISELSKACKSHKTIGKEKCMNSCTSVDTLNERKRCQSK